MATLRPSLTREQVSGDFKRDLSALILCFLISAWIHLALFTVWEKTDARARDNFYFELADPESPPVLELSLIMAPPPPPEAPPEPAAAGPSPALPVDDAPLPLDKGLAKAELLPPDENREPFNPDPPVVLEAEAPKFKSYYTLIRGAVARNWIMSPEARAQFRPSRLTVEFTVGGDGSFLRLVVVQSTGSPTLDHAGLEAVRSAAPFPPFPEELRQYSQLDIRMHFDYQAQYIKRPAADGQF